MIYCLDQVPAVVRKKPALATVEPFKTVLSDDREAIAKFTLQDLEAILVATLTDITADVLSATVKTWIATASTQDGNDPTPT
jgi:hypothetical protein